MENSTCAKCLKTLRVGYEISCQVCKNKFHKICAKVDNKETCELLASNTNIVFNCDICLQNSSNLVSSIARLTKEVNDLKILLSKHIGNSVNSAKMLTGKSPIVAAKEGSTVPTSMPPAAVLNVAANYNSNALSGLSYARTVVGTSTITSVRSSTATVSDNLSPSHSVYVAENAAPISDALANAAASSTADRPHANVLSAFSRSNSSAGANSSTAIASAIGLTPSYTPVDQTTLVSPMPVNADWTKVEKRKRKNKFRIVGSNANTELEVVDRMRWLHISSFKPSVSADNVIDFISKHAAIDKQHISCYALVKQQTNLSSLNKVNFKLGVSANSYDKLLSPDLWPANVNIRPFRFFPKEQKAQNLL